MLSNYKINKGLHTYLYTYAPPKKGNLKKNLFVDVPTSILAPLHGKKQLLAFNLRQVEKKSQRSETMKKTTHKLIANPCIVHTESTTYTPENLH